MDKSTAVGGSRVLWDLPTTVVRSLFFDPRPAKPMSTNRSGPIDCMETQPSTAVTRGAVVAQGDLGDQQLLKALTSRYHHALSSPASTPATASRTPAASGPRSRSSWPFAI